ncbi:hypothetical protein DMENIID0001_155000 [Sergentomyia squamirostris]
MRHFVILTVAVLSAVGCVNGVLEVVATNDGQPGCFIRYEFERLWRNNFDQSAYWRCERWGEGAVRHECPPHTSFQDFWQTCLPNANWQWTPYSDPPTRPGEQEVDQCEPLENPTPCPTSSPITTPTPEWNSTTTGDWNTTTPLPDWNTTTTGDWNTTTPGDWNTTTTGDWNTTMPTPPVNTTTPEWNTTTTGDWNTTTPSPEWNTTTTGDLNTTTPGDWNTTTPGDWNTTTTGDWNTTTPSPEWNTTTTGDLNTTTPGDWNTTTPGDWNTTTPGDWNTTTPHEGNTTRTPEFSTGFTTTPQDNESSPPPTTPTDDTDPTGPTCPTCPPTTTTPAPCPTCPPPTQQPPPENPNPIGICPGATDKQHAAGDKDCAPPPCTWDQWLNGTLYPTRDPTKFFQCAPGEGNLYVMPCGPATCFSFEEQVCVHVHDWKNPCNAASVAA